MVSTSATLVATFPRTLLPLLRCSRDAGPLVVTAELQSNSEGISRARLRCSTCATEYAIEDGVARLMEEKLDSEDELEMALRDRQPDWQWVPEGERKVPVAAVGSTYVPILNDLLEMPDHLSELKPLGGCTVLELGCGTGRFTTAMVAMGAEILAVDFSIASLRVLASRLPQGAQVGLVQADINHFHIAERCFDRAFSTTPLDSREQRMAMYRMVAGALKDTGRFVGSVEHDDLHRCLLGLPRARRYSPGGIFLEHLDTATLSREAAPYFLELRIRPIRPRIPFLRRVVRPLPQLWAVRVLRTFGTLPVLRNFGEILLLRAERPVRLPVEGESRPGNKLAKTFFRWYMQAKGRPAVWDTHERV